MTKSDKYLRFMVIISVKKSPQKSGRMPDYADSNTIYHISYFPFPTHHYSRPLLRTTLATHYTEKIICCTEVK